MIKTTNRSFEIGAHLLMFAGPGVRRELEVLVGRLGGSRPLIVTDKGCVNAGIIEKVMGVVPSLGGTPVFDTVQPDPDVDTAMAAVAAVREADADLLIAIGGGSAIDTAKTAAALVTNGGKVTDYVGGAYGSDPFGRDPLPMIAIPTTAGTGSEVSQNIAISDSSSGIKHAIRSERLRPRAQLLDPELLVTLPSHVAAHSGLDALSHALEGYCSKRANRLTDNLAVQALDIILNTLPAFVIDPADTMLGTDMLYGSMLAGIVFSNTGTGNGHAIGRALGGKIAISHGLAVALVLPHVVRFNAEVVGAKLDALAAQLGLDPGTWESLVQKVTQVIEDVGITPGLRKNGIRRRDFEDLADVALTNVGPNPRDTKKDDLLDLLKAAW